MRLLDCLAPLLVVPGALALALTGCGGGEPAAPAGPQPLLLPPFPLAPVVADAQAELSRRIEDPPPVGPADPERVQGLVATHAGGGEFADLALDEARELGDAAVPELARLVGDADAADGERASALTLLATIDTPASLEILLDTVEHGAEPWLRRWAAYGLRATDEDWILPRLVLRLKYETDYETVLWMADRLARFANYSGIEGALVVWHQAPDDELKERAAGFLVAWAEEAGAPDAAELERRWLAGETDEPERSPELERELWRWIARLEEYQLRGVDDARFLLSRSGTLSARLLARALHDQSVYVRVHAAQSLERMGPRARVAGDELVLALGEPTLAPNAAAALGAIAYEPAFPVLCDVVERHPDPDLRLAAARALGGFAADHDGRAEAVLRPLLEGNESLELRQAAGDTLVRLDVADPPLAQVAAFVTDDDLAWESSERALRAWLARHAEDPGIAPVIERWDALEPPPDRAVPREERAASRAERRALIEGLAGSASTGGRPPASPTQDR